LSPSPFLHLLISISPAIIGVIVTPDYFSQAEGRYDFLRLSLNFVSCALCRMVVPCFAKSVSDLNAS
jgi:hypothetical protein